MLSSGGQARAPRCERSDVGLELSFGTRSFSPGLGINISQYDSSCSSENLTHWCCWNNSEFHQNSSFTICFSTVSIKVGPTVAISLCAPSRQLSELQNWSRE